MKDKQLFVCLDCEMTGSVSYDEKTTVNELIGLMVTSHALVSPKCKSSSKRFRTVFKEVAQHRVHPTNGGMCAVCGKSADHHEDHDYVAPLTAISG